VLSQHHGIDRAGRHAQLLPDPVAEPQGVDRRAGGQDRHPRGQATGQGGQRVRGIRHDQDGGGGVDLAQFSDHVRVRTCVGGDESAAALVVGAVGGAAVLLVHTGSDDDEVRAGQVLVVAGAHAGTGGRGGRVREVLRQAHSARMRAVDDDDLRVQAGGGDE
jgi:hypothetical protein